MIELPATHNQVEPIEVSTTVVAREKENLERQNSFVYIDYDPDVFSTENPDVIVELTHGFDRNVPEEDVLLGVDSENLYGVNVEVFEE